MVKGAYFLGIELKKPLTFSAAALAGRCLEPGFYLYCGSAYGPGGLDARINRHLKKDKIRRWHVDWLTTAGTVRIVGRVEGGRECDLASEFSRISGSSFPIPGFGSSDCRICPSHLLHVDERLLKAHLKGRTMVEFLK